LFVYTSFIGKLPVTYDVTDMLPNTGNVIRLPEARITIDLSMQFTSGVHGRLRGCVLANGRHCKQLFW